MSWPRNRGEQTPRGANMGTGSLIGLEDDALVHELKKLQKALDQYRDEAREQRPGGGGPAPHHRHSDRRPPLRRPSAKSKGGTWLGLFGLNRAAPIDRTTAQRSRVDPIAEPRRPTSQNVKEGLRHPAAERPPGRPASTAAAKNVRTGAPLPLLQSPALEPSSGDLLERGETSTKAPPQAVSKHTLQAIAERNVKHLMSGCAFLMERTRGAVADEILSGELPAGLRRAYRNELRIGLRVLLVSLGVFGSWGMLVPLSSAVVVPGTLVVKSNVKKIQHQTGGVVAQIPVHDGMHVHAGDVVLRLDQTQRRAEYQVLMQQLNQVRVRSARLVAERDGLAEPKMPHAIAVTMDNPDVRKLWTSELLLFKSRAAARRSAKDLLHSRVGQLQEEVTGLEAQVKSKVAQRDLISGELKGVETLYRKGLVPLTRKTSLEREAARLDGDHGQALAAIAEAKSKISEAQLQIVRIDQDFATQVMKNLRDAQDKEAELIKKTAAVGDLLKRLDLRAPNDGIIQQLSVHTIGGVVKPGESVMEIVPDSGGLLIEAKLPPRDIDHVQIGQPTYVRFSAFNQRTTPQLKGVVSYVSPDLSHDRRTDAGYYTVRVKLPDDQRRRIGNLELVSGMPAEVFINTGTRTMMSYLLKPISDQLDRTFNER